MTIEQQYNAAKKRLEFLSKYTDNASVHQEVQQALLAQLEWLWQSWQYHTHEAGKHIPKYSAAHEDSIEHYATQISAMHDTLLPKDGE